jgi:hypothetical protein
VFEEHIYVNEDTAGIAIIEANSTSTQVKFIKPYAFAPIITVTPKKKMAGISWWVEEETAEGFIIAVDPTSEEELQFNWHALAVKPSTTDKIIEPELEDLVQPEEVVSEPVVETEPEATPEPEVSPEPEASPEPTEPAPESEPVVETKPEPTPEVEVSPEPEASPELEASPEPAPVTEPEPTPEPIVE